MPASSPSISPRRPWLLALPLLAFLASTTGWWLGDGRESREILHPRHAVSSARATLPPAPSLPGTADDFSSTSHPPSLQQMAAATPAAPPLAVKSTPPPDEPARRLFASTRRAHPASPELVDPSLPGHSVAAHGQRVWVEGAHITPATGQSAIAVAIIPDTASSSVAPAPVPSPATGMLTKAQILQSRIGIGFTDEELAFRAKWGWAAHHAALREAFTAADP